MCVCVYVCVCNYPHIDWHDTLNPCIKFKEILMRTS